MTTVDSIVASRRIRLTYADTDAARMLYFAAWFPWMERISVEWVYSQGYRYDDLHAKGEPAPVARATTCEYVAPARVYDEVDMAMRVEHIGKRSYRLGFTMTRVPAGVIVARSSLTLVFVNSTGASVAIPPAYRSMLEKARGTDG